MDFCRLLVAWSAVLVVFSNTALLWKLLPSLLSLLLLLVFVFKPVLGICGIMIFAFVNPSLLPSIGEIGQITIRWIDVFTAMIGVALFLRACVMQRFPKLNEWWEVFYPIVLFVGYAGLSLLWVWLKTPELFTASLASFLRLVATLILGMFIYISLSIEKDFALIERFFIIGMTGTIAIGLWESVFIGLLTTRIGGLMGINSLGLVSGLLVLYGWIRWRLYSRTSSIGFIAIGILGLVGTKSFSSIIATTVSIVLLLVNDKSIRRLLRNRIFKIFMATILGTALAIVSIWLLRRSDVEGFLAFSGGSFAQRFMIAYGALQIFMKDPIFGTGWQASGTSFYMGDYHLNVSLSNLFPNLPSHYFFTESPTSVHNLYLQLLTELGIIGFVIFFWTVFRVYQSVKVILSDLRSTYFESWASFMGLALFYLLVWWNTNPLYGGQTESLLAVAFLSILAAMQALIRKGQAKRQEMSSKRFNRK